MQAQKKKRDAPGARLARGLLGERHSVARQLLGRLGADVHGLLRQRARLLLHGLPGRPDELVRQRLRAPRAASAAARVGARPCQV